MAEPIKQDSLPPEYPPITNPPVDQDCISCKYGITRSYSEKTVLECRYSDPVVQGSKAVWGQVEMTDWCGRWAGR